MKNFMLSKIVSFGSILLRAFQFVTKKERFYFILKLFATLALLATSLILLYWQLTYRKPIKPVPVDYQVIIAGAGVAGLTSAIYLSQLGIKTLVVEGKQPGGALATTGWVENWPGEKKIMGRELIDKLMEHAIYSGVNISHGQIVDCKLKNFPYTVIISDEKKLSSLKTYGLIIATGATPKKLDIPGEQAHWGKGVTNCAICDGPLHKGKTVVIIGGGDSAMTEAQILAQLAEKVYIFIRNESKAKPSLLESVNRLPNVRILYHTKPLAIVGDQTKVTGIEYDCKGERKTMNVSGVFLAIGSTPNTDIFGKHLKLDKNGLILVDKNCKTSIEGIFAVGDAVNEFDRQAIIASGQGCLAALDAIRFINENGLNNFPKKIQNKSSLDLQIKKIHKKPSAKTAQISEINDLNNQRVENQTKYSTKITSNSEVVEKPIKKSHGVKIATSIEELEEIMSSCELPILVDFFATWCSPCKAMTPIIERLAQDFASKALVVKVNIDNSSDAASKHSIQGVPTLVIFKENKEITRFVGYTSQEVLADALTAASLS